MQAARGTSVAEDANPTETSRRSRGVGVYLLVALGGLLLDQVSKNLAVRSLEPGVVTPLLGPVLQLRLIRNPGAAFSLGERFTIVFALLSVVVLAFVVVRLVPRLGHRGWGVALGLLTAGVCGNLGDRVFREPSFLHGHVVDFLELPHWPIFNVADTCISTAAVLIVVLAMIRNVAIDGRRYPRPDRRRPGAD